MPEILPARSSLIVTGWPVSKDACGFPKPGVDTLQRTCTVLGNTLQDKAAIGRRASFERGRQLGEQGAKVRGRTFARRQIEKRLRRHSGAGDRLPLGIDDPPAAIADFVKLDSFRSGRTTSHSSQAGLANRER